MPRRNADHVSPAQWPLAAGGAQISFTYKTASATTTNIVSGTLTMIQNNGCTAFGNADASSVAK
jgi:hypothetical protein